MDIALVHGSYHGAWCWDLLVPELARRGHRVVTVDLPTSDPAQGGQAYADVIVKAIEPLSNPVLVGHSMAGLVIPLVAARQPVRRLVFLAAFLAQPGKSANDQRKAETIEGKMPLKTAEFTDLGDDVWMIGPNTARELFFHDAPAKVAAWAAARLRPQCYRVFSEASPLRAWPKVESSYIVCRDDRAMNPDWGREVAKRRLRTEAIEIAGSHSPFLTRPGELALTLDKILG